MFAISAHAKVILSFKVSDIGLDEGAHFPFQIHHQNNTDKGHHEAWPQLPLQMCDQLVLSRRGTSIQHYFHYITKQIYKTKHYPVLVT